MEDICSAICSSVSTVESTWSGWISIEEVPAPMEKTFINPATNKQWCIEIDGLTIVLEKVNWVNDHKDTIIRAFLDENDDCIDVVNEMIEDGTLEADGKISEDEFVKALFVNNVTVFVNGSETGFYIDLDAEPDYFMGHLVCIEVNCKYKIEVGGFNG